MKYAAKNADCTSITSPYDSVNNAFSFGMSTSFRLVMPPKAKNKAKTNAVKSFEYAALVSDAGCSNALAGAPIVSNAMQACLPT